MSRSAGPESEERPPLQGASFVGQAVADPVIDLARANPALTVTALTSAIILVQVLDAARYQPESVLAIVNSAPTASILLGTVVQAVPWVITPLAVAGAAWARAEYQRGRRAAVLYGGSFALFLLAMLIAPAVVVVGYVLVFGILDRLVTAWRSRRAAKQGRVLVQERLEIVYGLLIVMTLANVILLARPWMPPEAIQLSGQPVVVGYVLSDAGRWMSVLRDSDRQVVRIESTSVVSRTICRVADSGPLPTLTQLTISPVAAVKTCP